MIASYYSTTLEFYELVRTTCLFTNVCKGRLHGRVHLQQFKEINTFVYIVYVKIPGLQEGTFTTQLI